MVDAQISFLLNTVGLVIVILGSWSAYASMPKWEEDSSSNDQRIYAQTRNGFRNLGLFLTIGLLMQYVAGL